MDDDINKDGIFDIVDKQKYEQTVSECKKLWFSLNKLLGGPL